MNYRKEFLLATMKTINLLRVEILKNGSSAFLKRTLAKHEARLLAKFSCEVI